MQAVNERRKEHARFRSEELEGLSKRDVQLRQRKLGLIQGAFLDDRKRLTASDAEGSSGALKQTKTLNFVIKGDVIGSVEAVINLISGLGNSAVGIEVVRATTGALCKADIEMAKASDATILAFNADVSLGSKSNGCRVRC